MIQAILSGRKTQTRRIIKPQPPEWVNEVGPATIFGYVSFMGDHPDSPCSSSKCLHIHGPSMWTIKCSYGAVGHTLWVRESFSSSPDGIIYRATQSEHGITECDDFVKWRPSIHMPRWASRITLEITGVRVERLQEITEEDAIAEGCDPWTFNDEQPLTSGELGASSPYRGGYAVLWDEINDARAPWKSNPFVFVISFKRV